MILIHFCRGQDFIANLLKLVTLGEFSHCAIQIGDYLYEATFSRGVSRTTIEEFNLRYPDRELVAVYGADEEAALAWLEEQVGKDYDYTALTALPFRGSWQDESKWFCSELVAAALKKAKAIRIRVEVGRVTPKDLWFSNKIRWKYG